MLNYLFLQAAGMATVVEKVAGLAGTSCPGEIVGRIEEVLE
jgi:hypothetical protein